MNKDSLTLLVRENLNRKYVREADNFRLTDGNKDFSMLAESLQSAIVSILGDMNIRVTEISLLGCETVADVMDCMLDPFGIMYEKLETSKNLFKNRTETMLAVSKKQEVLKLTPSLFGYRYENVRTQETGNVNPDDLGEYVYAIYQPIPPGKNVLMSMLRLVYGLLTTKDVVPMILCSMLITLTGMGITWITGYVLNNLVLQGTAAVKLLVAMTVFLIVLGLSKTLCNIFKNLFMGKTIRRISFQVQSAVIARCLLDPNNHKHYTTAEYTTRIKKSRELAQTLVQQCFKTYITVFFSLGYVFQMGSFSFELLFPAIFVFVIRIAVALSTSKMAAENEQNILQKETNLNELLNSSLKGIQNIRSRGADANIYMRWMSVYVDTITKRLNPPILVRYRGSIESLIAGLATLSILAVAVANKIDAGVYYTFSSAYALAMTSVDLIVESIYSMANINATLDSLHDLFEVRFTDILNKEYVRELGGTIQIQNVSFKFQDADTTCLKDISLEIRKGEKIAIVGESGCGKSAFLRLILGLIQPDSGSVRYDGIDINQLNMRSVRRRMGMVFQFSRLSPDTVGNNIRYGKDSLSDEELWEAAEKAAIAEDIQRFPEQMETVITESNSGGLSGGQRQRILLARAFAAKPQIMILDEATSALDNISQAKVLDSIYKLDATVIMVAHRLSTISGCDRIVVMHKGRIEEIGSYNELIEKNGYFTELIEKQRM